MSLTNEVINSAGAVKEWLQSKLSWNYPTLILMLHAKHWPFNTAGNVERSKQI